MLENSKLNYLLYKLQKIGINSHMFFWTKDYLHGRSARVSLDGEKSKLVKLQEGVPQGSVLAPTLFLIFINDLPSIFNIYIHRALHADDLAIWTEADTTGAARTRIQEAVDQVATWARDWGVQINRTKTVTTLFSLCQVSKYTITLDGEPLPQEDTPTYLGVKFDKRLTWRPHIEEAEKKATLRLRLMKKLSGTTWGADCDTAKQVYTGYVRPTLEYGAGTYATAAKTNLKKLDKVQNSALRIIIGGIKSSPIESMEATTGLHNLEERREEKVVRMAEKFKRLKKHPMNRKVQELLLNRIDRSSFNHLSKRLATNLQEIVSRKPEEWEELSVLESAPLEQNYGVELAIPGIEGKEDELEPVIRAKTLEHLDRTYPRGEWIRIYTDGSAQDAVRDGGAGVVILRNYGPNSECSVPTGKLSTNFRAEMQAILEACKLLEEEELQEARIVFFSDCKSVLQKLQKEAEDDLSQNTIRGLEDLAKSNLVILQWIPAHCGIAGNERADILAKLGSRNKQFSHKVSYSESKSLVKQTYQKKWRERTRSTYPQDPILALPRKAQVTIFRLRTGHCRLKAHLHHLKLAPSPYCHCGQERQTPEHILQQCPLLADLRQSIWTIPSTLEEKLEGSLENLWKTVEFIEGTRLEV